MRRHYLTLLSLSRPLHTLSHSLARVLILSRALSLSFSVSHALSLMLSLSHALSLFTCVFLFLRTHPLSPLAPAVTFRTYSMLPFVFLFVQGPHLSLSVASSARWSDAGISYLPLCVKASFKTEIHTQATLSLRPAKACTHTHTHTHKHTQKQSTLHTLELVCGVVPSG